MKIRLTLGVAVLLVNFLAAPLSAQAQAVPELKLGFAALADRIPEMVGQPLEDEHSAPNGDSLQTTSKGMLVWRKADNWTAFTDGSRTWISGPLGIQVRPNDEKFSWERGAKSLTSSAVYVPEVKAMDEESAMARAIASNLMRELDEQWGQTYSWHPAKPVTVYLYFDGYRLADGYSLISGYALTPDRRTQMATSTAGLKLRDTRTGGWAILANVGRYYGTNRWEIRIKHLLTHEYTHVMQSDAAGSAGPAWFDEGMAELTAFSKVPEAMPFLGRTSYVSRARDKGELPSLAQLHDDWRNVVEARGENAQLAYGASYLAVKYLSERVGTTGLLNVLKEAARGRDFRAALQEVTGYDLDRLDSEYRQTIP